MGLGLARSYTKSHNLYKMKAKLLILLVILILVHEVSYGQVNRKSLLGNYECIKTTDNKSSIDTVGWQNDTIPILKINIVEVSNFSSKTLILKRNNRVIIMDNSPITDIGINIDNPTIYGKYKIKGDSIIIRAKYSIQHFNALAPNKRVKLKLDTVYRFKVMDDGQLQISPNFSWTKIDTAIKSGCK